MQIRFRAPALAVAAAALAIVTSSPGVILGAGQTVPYRAPRGPDGKPNLNGIWQALNEADWDIEGHSAAPGRLMALGAEDAVVRGSVSSRADRFRTWRRRRQRRRRISRSA